MTAALKRIGWVEVLLVLLELSLTTNVDASQCTPLVNIAGGGFSLVKGYPPNDRGLNSIWELTCNTNYNVDRQQKANTTCLFAASGELMWTPSLSCSVNNWWCDPFPEVANGKTDYLVAYMPHNTGAGSVYQVKCDAGYHIEGQPGVFSATSECHNRYGGVWTVVEWNILEWTADLKCVPISPCPSFPDVVKGKIFPDLNNGKTVYDVGSKHEVLCDTGYHIDGQTGVSQASFECLHDTKGSRWSPILQCVPNPSCPSFPDVGLGKILLSYNNGKNAYDVGSMPEVLCDTGYHIDGQPGTMRASFQCLSDAKGSRWSPQLQCVRDASTTTTTTMPSKCGQFFDVGFGQFLVDFNKWQHVYDLGSMHDVLCSTGNHIDGQPGTTRASVQCLRDASGMPTWTPSLQCVADARATA